MLEKIVFDFKDKNLDINWKEYEKEYENIKFELQKSLENCFSKLDSIQKQQPEENQQSEKSYEEKNTENTSYSKNIMERINSTEEYDIYKNANLVEDEEGNLIRTDIDPEQKDPMGRTNRERCKQGLPPLDKNGNPIELHHIGQKKDAPLAELTQEEHRGKGNDTILHDKKKESEIDRDEFAKERREYWKNREL